MVCSLVGTFVMFYKEETSPCQVEEDDQTNILQGKLRLLGLVNFVAMMTNRARLRHGTPFGADALFCEDIQSLLSNSASRSGPRLPDAPCAELVLLPQGRRLVFSPTGKRATKKRKRKQEKEEGKTFRSERTVNFGGQRANDFWTKKSSFFLLRLFWPCWGVDEPKLEFALCLYLDNLSLRRTRTSTFLAVKNRLENGTLG